MNIRALSLIVAGIMSTQLIGCATPSASADVYSNSDARNEQSIRFGVVESVRTVSIEGRTESGFGQVAGAAVGGVVASSNVGRGSGSAVAGILGSVVGAVVGNQIERSATSKTALEIIVRLDGGQVIAVTQEADIPFKAGDAVRVLSAGGMSRVTPR